MEIKRRDFLRLSLAAGTAVAFGGPTLNAFANGKDTKEGSGGTEPGQWIPSHCQGCTAWCPAEFFVQNGRAVKVSGNHLCKANNGYVCPRGHLMLQELYGPDRIKIPMKRTNPQKGRGIDPKFVPISWDEAMDIIAEKMMELRKNNETQKFMLLRGRYSPTTEALAYGTIPRIFGSPNNISHSSICAEAEKFGRFYTEGYWGYRDYDLAKTKYLVILTEGLWSKEFAGDFKDGKNFFKAGQTVDEAAFGEKYTHGLVKWWNIELKDRTPEWAAKFTLIPKEQIIRVARGMGKAAPYVAVWLGPGPVMSPRGAYPSFAIHALNGLLGSVDHEGGTLRNPTVPQDSMPKLDAYLDEIAKKGGTQRKIDQRGTKAFPTIAAGRAGSGVVTNNVANAILSNDPYDIKVALGSWNKFNFSCTGADRWDKAMAKIQFYVHISTNPAEMTQFADVVLPAAHHATEKLSIITNKANLYAHMSIQQPVVKRMWDVKADETEIMWLLAEKLKNKGFPHIYDYFSKDFKDPETGKTPTNAEEFAEIA